MKASVSRLTITTSLLVTLTFGTDGDLVADSRVPLEESHGDLTSSSKTLAVGFAYQKDPPPTDRLPRASRSQQGFPPCPANRRWTASWLPAWHRTAAVHPASTRSGGFLSFSCLWFSLLCCYGPASYEGRR